MGVADVLKGTELIPDFGGIEDDWLAIVYEFKGLLATLLSLLLVALVSWRFLLKRRREQAERVATVGSRFRKRDKVLFYGRKVLRTVKSISGQVRNGPRSLTKQPRRVVRLARQFLRMKKDSTPTQLKVLGPEESYLEADVGPISSDESRLPTEVLYMLKSIRVFGHFDRPVFLELCKHINTLNLMAGNVLFTIGDPDDSVYVVQSGLIEVFVATDSGLALSLKLVQPGEPLFSLLSFADVLTGHTNPFKTVSARAVEDSTILRLPMHAFSLVFDSHPDLFVRVMQVILIRLQRITFTALLQYLGLTSQILVPTNTPPAPPSPVRTTAAASVPSRGEYTPPPLHLQDSGQGGSGTEGEGPPHEEGRSRYIRGFRALSRQETEAFTRQAKEGLTEVLGLQGSEDTLDGKIGIREGIHGTYLVKQESHKDSAIYYVLSGTLSISLRDEEAGHDRVLFLAHPGQIVGGLSVLTGEPSFFSVRIKGGPGLVAFIKKQHLYSIMAVQPRVVLHIVNSLIRILSPVVRQVDFALDWTTMEAGKAIYRQDEEADCMYIILSGRLRSVLSLPSGKKDLVGEHGRGDLVGVVEMITKRPRGTSVIAVRDSELVRVSAGLLNHLKMKFPQIVTKLIQLLGHRIMGSWQRMSSPTSLSTLPAELRQTQSNLSTIALLAVTDDVPLSPFALELLHTLSVIGPCIRLTSDSIRKELGAQITNEGNEYQLNHWLQKQEDYHRMVLYQCDSTLTNWTKQCIRQADCILIVALASREPSVGKIEYQLDKLAVRTQKELVLLHREDSPLPRKTAAWLNMRSWCSFHHHIRCPPRMFAKKSQSKIAELYKKVSTVPPDINSDFSRLARILTGTSVGLVLGGGGARGAAHVGMIKAIMEKGVPVDLVGGTSIGAFVGALWARETNITAVTTKARDWSYKVNQVWRQVLDLTYPITAWFTGRGFNSLVSSTLGENVNIEDLWIPYFCVTTDITNSTMRIHTHGSLWRYVRSSMSLSGFMPPLCDPRDGHLLLDGGYINNLPADVMRNMGANTILAIDVGSQDESDMTNYGDCLSGFWLLWKRIWPFGDSVKIPDLPDIQSRLAYVSCVRQLEEVKNCEYCEYIRPPIDKYKTLQFGCFDEIKDVGYNHGYAYFTALSKFGALNTSVLLNRVQQKQNPTGGSSSNVGFFGSRSQSGSSGNIPKDVYQRRGSLVDVPTSSTGQVQESLTDLAQVICKLGVPKGDSPEWAMEDESPLESDFESEDDEQSPGYASEPGFRTPIKVDHRRAGSLSDEALICNRSDE